MEKMKALSLGVLAALLICAMVTPLRAVQVEAIKQAESKPSDNKPAGAEAAEAQPAGGTRAAGAATECAPGKGVEACGESTAGPDIELGLDKTIPPVSYEEAMSMDLSPLAWQRIRQINKLHQDIEKRVKLSTEQREMLRSRFHQIYATIIEHPTRAGWKTFNYPALTPEERSNLEGELAQAQANMDSPRAEALRMRILQGTFGTEQNIAPAIETTAVVLKDKLDADQREIFQLVLDRWYLLEVRGPMDVPTRMLIRALKDPELKLDPAFVQKAEAKINEKVALLPAPPERRHHLAKAAEELKTEILAELPPEKREAIDSTYAYLIKEREAVDEYTRESFKKRGSSKSPTH